MEVGFEEECQWKGWHREEFLSHHRCGRKEEAKERFWAVEPGLWKVTIWVCLLQMSL